MARALFGASFVAQIAETVKKAATRPTPTRSAGTITVRPWANGGDFFCLGSLTTRDIQ